MTIYPPKLKILFPIYETREYRSYLAAIDDSLTVCRRPDGEFLLELARYRKLGPRSFARCLIDLADALEEGYTLVIVDRDRFLENIEALAGKHAAKKDREAVERAAHVVAERIRHQIRDHLDAPKDSEHMIARALVASRERRTKAYRQYRKTYGSAAGAARARGCGIQDLSAA